VAQALTDRRLLFVLESSANSCRVARMSRKSRIRSRLAGGGRRIRGVVDHQVVNVVVVTPAGKGLAAGDVEGARGGEILHLADHRCLDTLAGAEQVVGVCGKSRARSAETMIKAPPPSVNGRS
jgi:hypothetical protein